MFTLRDIRALVFLRFWSVHVYTFGILEASPRLLKMAVENGDYNKLRLSIYGVSELVKISIQCVNKSVNPLSEEQPKLVYIYYFDFL